MSPLPTQRQRKACTRAHGGPGSARRLQVRQSVCTLPRLREKTAACRCITTGLTGWENIPLKLQNPNRLLRFTKKRIKPKNANNNQGLGQQKIYFCDGSPHTIIAIQDVCIRPKKMSTKQNKHLKQKNQMRTNFPTTF
jgi:hypothetical protein